jgi:hypothetical protein
VPYGEHVHEQREPLLTATGGGGIVAPCPSASTGTECWVRMGSGSSWVYWAAIAAAFALLIVDLFDEGAIWNIGVVLCLIIAIAVRPGGIRGPGAAANEPAPRGR